MIQFDPSYLPFYLGSGALLSVAVTAAAKSATIITNTYFNRKNESNHALDREYLRGLKYGSLSIVSIVALTALVYAVSTLKPNKESQQPITDEDFSVCKINHQEFLQSEAYLDANQLIPHNTFCRDFFISLEEYRSFLEQPQQNMSDQELLVWQNRIEPYFNNLKWMKKTALDLTQYYNEALAVCQKKFDTISEQIKEDPGFGISFYCEPFYNRFFNITNESCERFVKMKMDYQDLSKIKRAVENLSNQVKNFFNDFDCKSIYRAQNEELDFFEIDLSQHVCSKKPFNATSLCN